MGVCEICNAQKGDRIISEMSICNDCFAKLQGLRNGNEYELLFFRNPTNVSKFSPRAKKYIDEVATEIEKTKKPIYEIISERERIQEDENKKREYARSEVGLFEYEVVTILNEGHGCVDTKKMTELINDHAKKGCKLHTVYSNELGKNALRILNIGVNTTACEDVLIFERRIKDR